MTFLNYDLKEEIYINVVLRSKYLILERGFRDIHTHKVLIRLSFPDYEFSAQSYKLYGETFKTTAVLASFSLLLLSVCPRWVSLLLVAFYLKQTPVWTHKISLNLFYPP